MLDLNEFHYNLAYLRGIEEYDADDVKLALKTLSVFNVEHLDYFDQDDYEGFLASMVRIKEQKNATLNRKAARFVDRIIKDNIGTPDWIIDILKKR